MTTAVTEKFEIAFGKGPLQDISSLTTSGSTNTADTVTTPVKAAMYPTTRLDLVFKISTTAWSSGTAQVIASNNAASPNLGWTLALKASAGIPELVFTWSTNGTTTNAQVVDIPLWADGSTNWLRLTVDFNVVVGTPGASNRTGTVLTSWVSNNGTAWVPYAILGVNANTGTPFHSTAALSIGASAFTVSTVTFYAFQMFVDSGVTPVASLDIDERWATTDTSWTDAVGNVWTAGAAITFASAWVDVTADVLHDAGIVLKSGRSTDLDKFQPSTASFTLRNDTRKYDPAYAAGTYFGKLLPRVPVRVRGQYNSVNYSLYRGIITSGFPQQYDAGNKWSFVPLDASDEFAILTNTAGPTSAFDADMDLNAAIVAPALDVQLDSSQNVVDNGSSHFVATIRNGLQPASSGDIYGSSAGALDIESSGQTVEFAGAPVTAYPFIFEAVFRTSVADYTQTFSTSLLELFHGSTTDFYVRLDQTGITLNMSGSIWTPFVVANSTGIVRLFDGEVHHLLIDMTALAPRMFLDGVDLNAQNPALITPGSLASVTGARIGTPYSAAVAAQQVTIDRVTIWPWPSTSPINTNADAARRRSALVRNGADGQRTDERLRMVLEAGGWPGNRVNIEQGQILVQGHVGGGSVLDNAQVTEATEYGALFIDGRGWMTFYRRSHPWTAARSTTNQYTLTDDGTGTDYLAEDFAVEYDDKLLYNEYEVSRAGGPTVTGGDVTSVAAYGPKSWSGNNLLHRNDSESQALGQGVVYLHKDIAPRVDSVTIYPENAPAVQYPQALGARIADRVTAKRKPQGVGSSGAFVCLVEGITHTYDSAEWRTTLLVNTQTVKTNWFTWGTSKWGVTTVATDVWSF